MTAARISYRLSRLYGVLQENRRQASEEQRDLQTLVSDISHQVKTPVANLIIRLEILSPSPATMDRARTIP